MLRAEAGVAGPGDPGGLSPRSVHHQVFPEDSPSRVIVHVDLDCFYAQVEMILNPELRGKPLGVQQKSLMVTCNYEARKLGVKKVMSVRDAKERYPQLVLVNGEDLTHYREMSYKVTELLEEFSPIVERLGFDENFVDVTDIVEKRLQQLQSDELPIVAVSGHVYNNQPVSLHDTTHCRLLLGAQVAAEMREAMYSQLGLTGCAGVASNKLLAKLVSGTFKPNQQTVLLPESSQDLIQSLKHIKELPGIGYKTSKRLEALGISSVHDLQTFSSKILEKELGISVAHRIQNLSFGEDDSPVTPSGPPQSFSEEDSFKKCSSEIEAKHKIEELLASLLNRVRRDGRKPHTVRLALRRHSLEKNWSRESRQRALPAHVVQKFGAGNDEVMTPVVDILMKLFRDMVNVKMPFHLTLLSVCFCNLKAINTSNKGTIDYYLTSSSPSASCSGKRSFKMCDTHMEEFSKDKGTDWGCLPPGSVESTRTGASVLESPAGEDGSGAARSSLPAGVDLEVFKQLPADIQEEILTGQSREKVHLKTSPRCSLPASRGILSFFSTKKVPESPLNCGDHLSSNQQMSSVSPGEPGTSGLNSSNSSNLPNPKDGSSYLDSRPKGERASPGSEEPPGSPLSAANPAVSAYRATRDLQSEQLPPPDFTAVSPERLPATAPHHGGQGPTKEKITFPSGIDPEVFHELPEEVQKELLAEWKRAGSDFHFVQKNKPDVQKKVS